MRTRLVLLGIALLLAACAWLFLRSHAGAAAVRTALPGDVARESGTDAALSVAAKPADEARRAGSAETRFEPLPEAPAELLVHVVDDVTKKPVAGATVCALETDSLDWWGTIGSEGGPVLEVWTRLQERGQRLESDSSGDLHLPVPRKWLALGARVGARFGCCCLSRGDGLECTLTLYTTHTCKVRTRESSGRAAAGVPVILGSAWGGVAWRGRTDTQGELLMPDVEWLVGAQIESNTDFYIGVEDATPSPACRWFSAGDPLPDTIELTLAPAVPLQVRVLASDGRAVPLRGTIELQAWNGRFGASLPRPRPASADLERGAARFARVEPGAQVELSLRFETAQRLVETFRLPADESEAQLEIRLPKNLQVVTATFVDGTGAALAGEELLWSSSRWRQGQCQGEGQGVPLHSDAQGTAVFVLQRDELRSDSEPTAELERGRVRLRRGSAQLESRPIEFSALGSAAVCELGQIRLERAVPIVRGRVVDDLGRAIERASITLERTALVDGREVRDTIECPQAESLADGSFEVLGECPGGRMSACGDRDGYFEPRPVERVEFSCGLETELLLRLERGGALRTSVRVDPGLGQILEWTIEHLDEERSEELETLAGGLLVRDTTGLAPGLHRVRLSLRGSSDSFLLDVPDVLVRPGELTIDARLQEVDLRGKLAQSDSGAAPGRVVVRVFDAQGRPCSDGMLDRFAAESGSEYWHGGRAELDRGDIGYRIGIWAPGGRAWYGPCPAVDTDLHLEPPLQVHVHVELPREVCLPGWSFALQSELKNEELPTGSLAPGFGSCWIDAHGDARFECPRPGRLVLGVLATGVDADHRIREGDVTLEVASERTIFVVDQPLEQDFELEITPEEWAAFAKALREAR